VQTLYSNVKLSGRNLFGKSLVVLQFIIAAALIICTLVFNRQFSYMTQSDLGFNKENIICIEYPWGKPKESIQVFKNDLRQMSMVENVASKAGHWNRTKFTVNGKLTDWIDYETMDDQYLQMLQIPLVKGRYLSYNNPADTISNCLVNETFAETLLDKNSDPIGQIVSRGAENALKHYTVIGVVKNYFNSSFKNKTGPIYFSLDKRGAAFNIYVKYKPGQAKATEAALAKSFKALLPFSTLNYQYMQDWNESWYAEEARWKEIVSYAAIIAIILSCMGLFALSTLSIQQRVKEIGIRKVLGATVSNIALLVSKDFLKLVFVALLISSPLAGWVMNKWLSDFVYRINMSWWIFALAGGTALLIAFITVGYHAFKAAIDNPVKSLRTE
jgi:putative ABC transport system permease protein